MVPACVPMQVSPFVGPVFDSFLLVAEACKQTVYNKEACSTLGAWLERIDTHTRESIRVHHAANTLSKHEQTLTLLHEETEKLNKHIRRYGEKGGVARRIDAKDFVRELRVYEENIRRLVEELQAGQGLQVSFKFCK